MEPKRGRKPPYLSLLPLTKARWQDFEALFGPRGACGGCWCMWFRLTRSEFDRQKGDGNREAMRGMVEAGGIPGILAYSGDEAVGWCSVAPRQDFPRLARSRIMKPVDQEPVWSVVCFFVARGHRSQGISESLLRGAIEHVRENGGRILEGYPVEPKKDRTPDTFAYTGLASAFRKVGFVEVARRSDTRPIMRYMIK